MSNKRDMKQIFRAVLLIGIVLNVTSSCGRIQSVSALRHDSTADGNFKVGVAKTDMTGPVLGLGTLGYGAPTPIANGIKQRLFSRAFVIESSDAKQRLAVVVLDTAFVSWPIKARALEILEEKHRGVFTKDNLLVSATHTHSAPGAYSNNHYYNVPFGGVSQENISLIADAIASSLSEAYMGREDGYVTFSEEQLKGANINRSFMAYLLNPKSERDSYRSSVDETAEQWTFRRASGEALGLINWFAVHGTSIEKDNQLVNGDNKGYASYLLEEKFKSQGDFVAAFPSKASGDSSPNIAKDVDQDGDWDCVANENFSCAEEIGRLQAEAAERLMNSGGERLQGPIAGVQHFYSMENQSIDLNRLESASQTAKTCAAAPGISMIAGSEEDGPGIGREGKRCRDATGLERLRCRANPCHGEKIVLINAGNLNPRWIEPELPVHLMRVGRHVLAGGPGEFTTMSGRRIVRELLESSRKYGVERVTFMTYANDFAGYTTTREEYQLQHYEGAHTVFGEWQLDAYQQNFQRTLLDLFEGKEAPYSLPPANNYQRFKSISGLYNEDSSDDFGVILKEAPAKIARGSIVTMTYKSSNPNHALGRLSSYFLVQRQTAKGWVSVLDDHDWSTSISWKKAGASYEGEIRWATSLNDDLGDYRVVIQGRAKIGNSYQSYNHTSRTFSLE